MLDRLISGAGAVTDIADRLARIFSRRGRTNALGRRPGSLIVAAVLGLLAVTFLFVGLEATDNVTPRQLAAAAVGTAPDIGNRTFATIDGVVDPNYVETYLDTNANDTRDAGEDAEAWYYFLVDAKTRTGVTVRSTRPPTEVFLVRATGTIVSDPAYVKEDEPTFRGEIAEEGITLETKLVIDTSTPVSSTAPPVDLAKLPAVGTEVSIAGPRLGSWVPFCSADPNQNGECDEKEYTYFDVVVYDPVSKHGIIVVMTQPPEMVPETFSGMLRRDERAVSEAKTTPGLAFADLGLTINDHYLLVDGATPASAPLAFGLAAVLTLLAATILVGLAGGYLIYRRSRDPLPVPAAAVALGERVPVHVSGVLRSTSGDVHVREADAELLRFETSAGVAGTEPPSTLIVERRGHPQGVALGRGELRGLSAGSVFPFRGPRAALRAVAGTGPVLLSFGSGADRDRAIAALLDETGLEVRDGRASAGTITSHTEDRDG